MTTKTETQETQIDATKIAADARVEERKRFATVQGSEHYAGREALAQKFLAETDMSAEQIVGFLKDAPKVEAKPESKDEDGEAEAKGKKRNHFAEAMGKEDNPQVGGVDDDEADGGDAEVTADGTPKAAVSILSAYRASGGRTRDRNKAS